VSIGSISTGKSWKEVLGMNPLRGYSPEELLILGFFLAYLVWLGLAAYILITRAIHDATHRTLRSTQALLRPKIDEATTPAERTRELERLLGSLPLRHLERVAADTSAPEWLVRPVAVYVVRRLSRRLIRRASSHHTERGRWRRIAALQILARAYRTAAMPLLEQAVEDDDAEVAAAAVRILGAVRTQDAAVVLVDALRSQTAAGGQIAPRLDEFFVEVPETIRQLLLEQDSKLRSWGATLVGRYSELAGLDLELAALTHDADPEVRAASVRTLAQVGGPVAERAAVALLSDDEPFVRVHAARALGTLGATATAALVATLLPDRDWWVRFAAKQALESFGRAAEEVLVVYLEHADEFARNGAAEVLQNIGVVDTLVVEAALEPADGPKTQLLGKIVLAGGDGLADAAAERLQPRRPGARRVLRRVTPAGSMTRPRTEST
jgi:HEAT repeat protein